MEQEFLEDKALWISKMRHGDMAEAARIAGVTRPTFHEWILTNGLCRHETDKRNLEAIKTAVRKREDVLRSAIAA